MKTNIGISEKNLKGVVAVLSKLLATEQTLYMKTRKFHWNVEGSSFLELHAFFETMYTDLSETTDSVAERIRSLGSYAPGSFKEFEKLTLLTEHVTTGPMKSSDMIAELLADHELIVRFIRESISKLSDEFKDEGTTDFVIGIMEYHEKKAWMLGSYLK